MKKKKRINNEYNSDIALAYEHIAKEKADKKEKELATHARLYEEICTLVGKPTLLDDKGNERFSFKQSVDFLIKNTALLKLRYTKPIITCLTE